MSQAHNYFAEAVQYGDSALSYIDHNFYKWLISNDGSEIVDILEIGQKENILDCFTGLRQLTAVQLVLAVAIPNG